MAYLDLPATDTHKAFKGFLCFGKDPNTMTPDEFETLRTDLDKMADYLNGGSEPKPTPKPMFDSKEAFVAELRKDLRNPNIIDIDRDIPRTELEYVRAATHGKLTKKPGKDSEDAFR
jgi:hypothetical protein